MGVNFGALRGVVHSFGAHAVALVQPVGGEVDGAPTIVPVDVGGSDAEDEGWG
jgi:hypothetical protein